MKMVAKNAKRLGVGANVAAAAQHDAVAAADGTKSGKKKILSIGKRRQHEDDDDGVIGGSKQDGCGSSSDEGEGRTSAVKERKRKVPNAFDSATSKDAVAEVTKGKKKKKGKKERAQENSVAAEDNPDDKGKMPARDDKANGSGELVDSNAAAAEGAVSKKHKRKKSRSRQKNIRKDNRSLGDKPSHLVLGTSEYAGRPLTKATKEKLGLSTQQATEDGAPASPKSKKHDSASCHNTNEMAAGGKGDVDASNELTMIGDCMVGEVVELPKQGTTAGNTIHKKPKRKFKNC